MVKIKRVFGKVDFRRKKKRENKEEKLFGRCLVGLRDGNRVGWV